MMTVLMRCGGLVLCMLLVGIGYSQSKKQVFDAGYNGVYFGTSDTELLSDANLATTAFSAIRSASAASKLKIYMMLSTEYNSKEKAAAEKIVYDGLIDGAFVLLAYRNQTSGNYSFDAHFIHNTKIVDPSNSIEKAYKRAVLAKAKAIKSAYPMDVLFAGANAAAGKVAAKATGSGQDVHKVTVKGSPIDVFAPSALATLKTKRDNLGTAAGLWRRNRSIVLTTSTTISQTLGWRALSISDVNGKFTRALNELVTSNYDMRRYALQQDGQILAGGDAPFDGSHARVLPALRAYLSQPRQQNHSIVDYTLDYVFNTTKHYYPRSDAGSPYANFVKLYPTYKSSLDKKVWNVSIVPHGKGEVTGGVGNVGVGLGTMTLKVKVKSKEDATLGYEGVVKCTYGSVEAGVGAGVAGLGASMCPADPDAKPATITRSYLPQSFFANCSIAQLDIGAFTANSNTTSAGVAALAKQRFSADGTSLVYDCSDLELNVCFNSTPAVGLTALKLTGGTCSYVEKNELPLIKVNRRKYPSLSNSTTRVPLGSYVQEVRRGDQGAGSLPSAVFFRNLKASMNHTLKSYVLRVKTEFYYTGNWKQNLAPHDFNGPGNLTGTQLKTYEFASRMNDYYGIMKIDHKDFILDARNAKHLKRRAYNEKCSAYGVSRNSTGFMVASYYLDYK